MKTDHFEKLSISVVVLETVLRLEPGLGLKSKAAKGKAAFIVMTHILTPVLRFRFRGFGQNVLKRISRSLYAGHGVGALFLYHHFQVQQIKYMFFKKCYIVYHYVCTLLAHLFS